MPIHKKAIERPGRRNGYTDFVRSLNLVTIALKNSTFRIKRDKFFEEERTLLADASLRPKRIGEEFFDLEAVLKVKVTGKKSSPILELSAVYELHFHGDSPINAKFVRRFANSDARFVIWPYFREYVSDVSARMYVPPVLLPLSK